MTESKTRQMLGSFIRTYRERLLPPIKSKGRRRTPGLRREELAEACGVGVTWITWLEQGRENVAASATTLARLADALHLTPAERASLFDLAGKRDPVAPIDLQENILPNLINLPLLFSVPAYLLDNTWTARAWNTKAENLFTGWLDDKTEERNLLNFVFLNDDAQTLIIDWDERASRLVAEFRADYNHRPNDVSRQLIIDNLLEKSQMFSKFWGKHAVLQRDGGERKFNHPLHGTQSFLQTTLLVASQQECKLVCLSPIK